MRGKDRSIHYQLRKGYISIIVFMMVCVAIGVIALTKVSERYEYAIKNYGFSQGYAGQLGIEFNAMIINLRNIILETDAESMQEIKESIEEQQKITEGYLAQVESCVSTDEERKLVENMKTGLSDYEVIREKIFEKAMLNQNDEAYRLLKEEGVKPANVVRENIDYFLEMEIEQCNALIVSAKRLTYILIVIIVIMEVTAVLLGIKMSRSMSEIICKPLEEIKAASEKLKQGELDITINYSKKNEIGVVAESFRESCSFLQSVIEDTRYILKEFSVGNFRIEFQNTEEYKGEFQAILENLQMLKKEMCVTLQAIQDASGQVAAGAEQMAASAVSLAEGATEQAGAVEELTATIDTVTGMVMESAKSAKEAFAEAQEYEQEAGRSNKAMEELTASMTQINAMSKKIGNIIAEIEDIASQTNLLSLNASIEAARAGEAGKGFAVVADQIGKLASESAKSAVHTRELIESSVAEIERGNQITNTTSQELGKMIEGIRLLGENAKKINEKAENEAEYMKQIQNEIEQISMVVQSNSAAAEESSATSEELSAQAVSLNEELEKFQLEIERAV